MSDVKQEGDAEVMPSVAQQLIDQTIEQEKGEYTPVSVDLKTQNGSVPELSTPRYTPPLRKRKVKRDDNPLALICEWAVEHQIGEPR